MDLLHYNIEQTIHFNIESNTTATYLLRIAAGLIVGILLK